MVLGSVQAAQALELPQAERVELAEVNVGIELNQVVLDNIRLEDIPKILSEVTPFIVANPSMNEAQINDYIASMLNERYKGTSANVKSLSSRAQMNDKEKGLLRINLIVGLKVINIGSNAKKRANARYTVEAVNYGNGDAFRHALWNALMVEEVGVTWATLWANAHEYYETGIDQAMDLYNNAKGREIVTNIAGGSNSPYWQPRLEGAIVKEIDNGNLKRIKNNTLTRTDSSGKR